MKIILRDRYMDEKVKDEIFCVGISEKYANELVKMLNNDDRYRISGKFYQVVSDDYIIKEVE